MDGRHDTVDDGQDAQLDGRIGDIGEPDTPDTDRFVHSATPLPYMIPSFLQSLLVPR